MTLTATTASPRTSTVTDLLRRAGDGEDAAWEEIVRRFSNVVFAKVRSFRLQDADALDAAQMTWLRLAENCHRVQSPEQLGGWLATTASRECLRIIRHHSKHSLTSTDVAAESMADPAATPEQRVIDADTAQRLWNLVAELPPRRRTLLEALFSDSPCPYAEISASIGIPPGGIGPTRARALEQLRHRLYERGLAPGA